MSGKGNCQRRQIRGVDTTTGTVSEHQCGQRMSSAVGVEPSVPSRCRDRPHVCGHVSNNGSGSGSGSPSAPSGATSSGPLLRTLLTAVDTG